MTNAAIGTPALPTRHHRNTTVSAPAGALPSQRAAHGDEMTTAPASRAHIVLADPELDLSRRLAEMLTPMVACTIDVAATVEEADRWMRQPGELAVISLRFGQRALATIAGFRSSAWRRVLALTAPTDTTLVAESLHAGATGILVSQRRSGSVATLPTSLFELSDREVEVITMVADGRSNKWIGQYLNLSGLTVKSHLARIGRKLGTGDRARIVQLALEAGVIR